MSKLKFNVDDEINTELDTPEVPTDEVEDKSVEDDVENIETIQDDTKEEFYAGGVYNELRDAMQDTDFRLFLIGNDLVIPGTLEGNEIQFLDIVGDDEDKEFVMKPAPTKLKDVFDFKTLYNVGETELEIPEDKEVKEAPHEEIVEYILGLKLKDEDAEDVEDDEQEIKTKENEEEEDDDESNEE